MSITEQARELLDALHAELYHRQEYESVLDILRQCHEKAYAEIAYLDRIR